MVRRRQAKRRPGRATGHADAPAQEPAGLTRRRFAALAGVLGAASGTPALTATDIDAFQQLSATLTGFPAAALDDEFARNLMQALKLSGRSADLDALIRGADVRDRAGLETEIVSSWYSGLIPGETEPSVTTVRGALIWRVLEFASPPGTCTTYASWEEAPPDETR